MTKRPVMQSFQNGLAVLSQIALADQPVSVSDLRQATGIAPSTLSRLLSALVEQGYIKRVQPRKFALDYGALLVGGQAILSSPLIQHGRRIADDLCRTLNRPAYIGTVWQERTFVLYHTWVHVQQDGYAFGRIGKRQLHDSSIGRIMLAFTSKDNEPTLKQVKEDGYATAVGNPPSLAAPIKDNENQVVAAIAVESSDIEEALSPLLAAASQLSAALGYHSPRLDHRITGGVP